MESHEDAVAEEEVDLGVPELDVVQEIEAFVEPSSAVAESESVPDPSDSSELPSMEEAIAQVPEKAKALMDELFRARLERVQRVDPKSIR